MKIASTPTPSHARDHARAGGKANIETPFTLPSSASENTDAPTAAAANSAAPAGGKTVPPGLEKVQARLMAIADEQRTHGQSQALASISRNIARYAEQQATATPVDDPTTETDALADNAASTESEVTATVADAETPDAVPESTPPNVVETPQIVDATPDVDLAADEPPAAQA